MKIINLFVFCSLVVSSVSLLSTSDTDASINELLQNPSDDQPAGNTEGEDKAFYNAPGMGGGGMGGGGPRWGGGGGGSRWGGGGGGGWFGGPRTWYKPWTWMNQPAVPAEDPNRFVGGGGSAELDDLARRIKKLEKLLGKPDPTPDVGPPQDK